MLGVWNGGHLFRRLEVRLNIGVDPRFAQVSASIRFLHGGDLLRSPFRHDASASVAAFRPEVDHPVGALDHFQIVLDDQDAGAGAQ